MTPKDPEDKHPSYADFGKVVVERTRPSMAAILCLLLLIAIIAAWIASSFPAMSELHEYVINVIATMVLVLYIYYGFFREFIQAERVELTVFLIARFIGGKQREVFAIGPDLTVDFKLEDAPGTCAVRVRGYVFEKIELDESSGKRLHRTIAIRESDGWREKDVKDLLVPILFIARTTDVRRGESLERYLRLIRPEPIQQ